MVTQKLFVWLLLSLYLLAGCATQSDPAPRGVKALAVPLWAEDNPERLPPTGFGKVQPLELQVSTLERSGESESIGTLTLATPLPVAPSHLPVYQVGNYPPAYGDRFTLPAPWDFAPRYSLVWYNSSEPLDAGDGAPEQIAARLLQNAGLLMTDSAEAKTTTGADGTSIVHFYRHLNDRVVYGNKPACVGVNKSRQVTALMIRRRPLVSSADYPLRTPSEAWQSLQTGGWFEVGSSACQDGGTPLPPKLEQFRVTQVELAYWEPHSDKPVQVMIPYYLFRDEQFHTLYVPAIAPEWLENA
ncbi:MAG TPA: hypothetical protein VK191_10785 [Symbiobacteriaceae bacterium]|nr:hypothetical protein [Symbiobacteriaceae bacterium]